MWRSSWKRTTYIQQQNHMVNKYYIFRQVHRITQYITSYDHLAQNALTLILIIAKSSFTLPKYTCLYSSLCLSLWMCQVVYVRETSVKHFYSLKQWYRMQLFFIEHFPEAVMLYHLVCRQTPLHIRCHWSKAISHGHGRKCNDGEILSLECDSVSIFGWQIFWQNDFMNVLWNNIMKFMSHVRNAS